MTSRSRATGRSRGRPSAGRPRRGAPSSRLTFTSDRKYPGIQGPRHWLRSSPDGAHIAFLMKDDEGRRAALAVGASPRRRAPTADPPSRGHRLRVHLLEAGRPAAGARDGPEHLPHRGGDRAVLPAHPTRQPAAAQRPWGWPACSRRTAGGSPISARGRRRRAASRRSGLRRSPFSHEPLPRHRCRHRQRAGPEIFSASGADSRKRQPAHPDVEAGARSLRASRATTSGGPAPTRATRAARRQAGLPAAAIRGIGFDATCSWSRSTAPTGLFPSVPPAVPGKERHRLDGPPGVGAGRGHQPDEAPGAALRRRDDLRPKCRCPKLPLAEDPPAGHLAPRRALSRTLPDFLTYRATGDDTRSLCTMRLQMELPRPAGRRRRAEAGPRLSGPKDRPRRPRRGRIPALWSTDPSHGGAGRTRADGPGRGRAGPRARHARGHLRSSTPTRAGLGCSAPASGGAGPPPRRRSAGGWR